jgi:3-hydroxybutyryl-CoA dehydratase
MSESLSKTVTERDIELFGEVSGDRNPVHFDEEYAKATIFKGRIAHGMLSASYISTVLGMQIPGPGTIFMSATIRFKAPVRIGDTVVTTCTAREVNEAKRRVIFDCVCKVNDVTVVEGETLIMAPSRAKA